MRHFPLKLLWVTVIFVLSTLPVYGADEVTRAAVEAFRHDPAMVTVQTNAGHRAEMYVYSCDGRYLFTANSEEVAVRDRATWRVIKSFPFRGTAALTAHPAHPGMMYILPSAKVYPSAIPSMYLLVNWQTGEVAGHVFRDEARDRAKLRYIPELLFYNKDQSRFGFVPFRSIEKFSCYGHQNPGQAGIEVSPDGKYLVVGSMHPEIFDLTRMEISRNWMMGSHLEATDTTLAYENDLFPPYVMMPKPKCLHGIIKTHEPYFNRNFFEFKFTDSTTVTFGGPTHNVWDWDLNTGTIRGYRVDYIIPGAIFATATHREMRVVASNHGVFFGTKERPIRLLRDYRQDFGDLLPGMPNTVAGPFADSLFLVGMTAGSRPSLLAGNFATGAIEATGSDTAWGEISDIKIAPDSTYALVTNGRAIRRVGLPQGKVLPMEPEIAVPLREGCMVRSCAILPDGRYVAGTDGGTVAFYDPATGKWETTEFQHTGKVQSICVSADGRHLFTADDVNRTVIWDAVTLTPLVTLVSLFPFDTIAITPDQYYAVVLHYGQEAAGKSFSSVIHIAKENRVYSLEQFDLARNRPDIIVRRLGGDSEYADLLEKAWHKRLRRAGVKPSELAEDFHVPECEFVNPDHIPTETDKRHLTLEVNVRDSRLPLKSVQVWINGVPQYGASGRPLAGSPRDLTLPLDIELARGENNIAVAVYNSNGTRSLSAETSVTYTVEEEEVQEPVLWVVAAGVSDYDDPAYRLRYAAKDARDIAALTRQFRDRFSRVETLCLTDGEFTSASLGKAGEFLKRAGRDDAVIVFFAGHGVLDSELDYYLAPHNMDFANPARHGVPMDRLLDLMDGIRPLQRYLMVDACHSGSFDKEDYLADNTIALTEAMPEGLRFRSVGGLRSRSQKEADASRLATKLFSTLGNSCGATVITAAAGNEVAVESDKWQNGLFTHLLKTGAAINNDTSAPEACGENNSTLTINNLATWVGRHAPELSDGRQHPGISTAGSTDLILFQKADNPHK